MTLKVTNTKTGKVFEHENTNHAWGDLAADMKADIVRGDTERLLTDGKTWYLLDECGNWEYLPSDYSVEGDPLSDISDLVEGRITGLDLLMATPAEERTEKAQDKYLKEARFELGLVQSAIADIRRGGPE